MLANTSDAGGTEYNSADATLWFLHAVGRHVQRTGDHELAAELSASLRGVIEHHLSGTRYGIKVDPADSLLRQGAEGIALTWMDARVDGKPVTQRAGKAVEINALWINALATVATLEERLKHDTTDLRRLAQLGRESFKHHFIGPSGCADVVDPDSFEVRPNSLLAVSLPYAPLLDAGLVRVAGAELLTTRGLRSLAATDPLTAGCIEAAFASATRPITRGLSGPGSSVPTSRLLSEPAFPSPGRWTGWSSTFGNGALARSPKRPTATHPTARPAALCKRGRWPS